MASIPTARTWTNSTDLTTASMMQNLTDCLTFMHNKPGAHLYTATGLQVNRATVTLVNWGFAEYDNDQCFSTATPSRLKINTTGLYQVTATACAGPGCSATLGSDMWLAVAKNSAGTFPTSSSANTLATDSHTLPGLGTGYTGGTPPASHVDLPIRLTSGDYLEMWLTYAGTNTPGNRWYPGGESCRYSFFLSAQFLGA